MDCQAFVLHYSTSPSIFPEALCELATAVSADTQKCGAMACRSGGDFFCAVFRQAAIWHPWEFFWESDFLLMKTGLSKEDIRPAGIDSCLSGHLVREYGHSGSFDNLTGCGLRPLTGSSCLLKSRLKNRFLPFLYGIRTWTKTVPVENTLLFAWALKKPGSAWNFIFSQKAGTAWRLQRRKRIRRRMTAGAVTLFRAARFGRSWRESGLNRFEAWKLFFGAFANIGWRI